MKPNVVENAIGQQIAGRVPGGQQIADPGRRNRELGHREGGNAASRLHPQASGIGQAAVAEFGRQIVRQAGDPDRKPGAVRDGNMGQREDVAPAVPGRQAGKGISADKQDQRLPGAEFATQAFEGMHGVARGGGLDLAGIHRKMVVFRGRPQHHLEPLLRGYLRRAAMRRLPGGDPAHPAEAKVVNRFLGQPQVAEMNGVESATENAERFRQFRI